VRSPTASQLATQLRTSSCHQLSQGSSRLSSREGLDERFKAWWRLGQSGDGSRCAWYGAGVRSATDRIREALTSASTACAQSQRAWRGLRATT